MATGSESTVLSRGSTVDSDAFPGSACLSARVKAKLGAMLAATEDADKIADYARLLADRNRVRIVQALQLTEELCVGDLAEVVRVEQSLVSHHLRILRAGGVIVSRREGPWIYYRLADETLYLTNR